MMPVFVVTTKPLPGRPRIYRTWCQEPEAPWRRCERALVVRVPFTRWALAVGRWHSRMPEFNAVIKAPQGQWFRPAPEALWFQPGAQAAEENREESETDEDVQAHQAGC